MVNFHTSVDCCKKYMTKISGHQLSNISPNVGDKVQVINEPNFILYMKVTERTWSFTKEGLSPNLNCYLSPEISIPNLEQLLESNGYSIH